MVRMTAPFTLRVEPATAKPALLLRPWQESDIAALVAAHRDEAMRRWLTSTVDDQDAARAWLADRDAGWAKGTALSWAVEAEGAVVGHVGVTAADPPKSLATGVGYWTAPAARGKGVASRCVEVATDWLFGRQDALPADEVELLHTVGNEGSCRVAHKCGYVLDSVLAPMPPQYPDAGHRHVRRRLA